MMFMMMVIMMMIDDDDGGVGIWWHVMVAGHRFGVICDFVM